MQKKIELPVLIAAAVLVFLTAILSHFIGAHLERVDERKEEVQRKIDILTVENARLADIKEWQVEHLQRLRADNIEMRELLHIPLDECLRSRQGE